METKPKTYHSLVFNHVEVDLSRKKMSLRTEVCATEM